MSWQSTSHENMNTKFDQQNLRMKSILLIRTWNPSKEETEVNMFLHSLTRLSILLSKFQVKWEKIELILK